MAKLFVDVLLHYREEGRFLLHEFTLLPDHFHLLLTPDSGISLERAMQFIKGGYSFRAAKELGFKGEVWQRGFTDHRVREARDFEAHRQYIWQNAVKRGLALKPEEYPYCSAFPGLPLDGPPVNLRG